MEVVDFAVSEMVTDVMMPMAVEFARFMVMAHVSTACLGVGDLVRISSSA